MRLDNIIFIPSGFHGTFSGLVAIILANNTHTIVFGHVHGHSDKVTSWSKTFFLRRNIDAELSVTHKKLSHCTKFCCKFYFVNKIFMPFNLKVISIYNIWYISSVRNKSIWYNSPNIARICVSVYSINIIYISIDCD